MVSAETVCFLFVYTVNSDGGTVACYPDPSLPVLSYGLIMVADLGGRIRYVFACLWCGRTLCVYNVQLTFAFHTLSSSVINW